jgi:hypothetical protein
MRTQTIWAALVLGFALINGSASFAQDGYRVLLTPLERHAYRACLFEAWIEDWCHGNSAWPTSTYDRVYAGCVAANRGGRFPLRGRNVFNTDDYCWAAAHTVEYRQR